MNIILIPFFFILWSASSAEIRKIKGVEGQIKSINFDSDFNNSYIVSFFNQSEWFYKLDEEKNIILTKNFYKVSNVLINSENDVYVFSFDKSIKSTYSSIWLLKNNSKTFKVLLYFMKPASGEINSFIDNDDNIFFNTKYGVSMLKPKQNIALAVGNLELKYYSRYLVDDSGDVYLKTMNENGFAAASIIKSDVKNQSVPNAEDSRTFKGEDTDSAQNNKNSQTYFGRFGTYIYSSSRSSQYVPSYDTYNSYRHNSYYYTTTTTTRYEVVNKNKGFIKKMKENSEETLLSEYDAIFKILHETDDRLFVLSEKSGDYYNIYYITQDEKILAINEVFLTPQINSSLCTSDKDGNVYFAYQKSIISLKENETESSNIEIPSDKYVSYILVDDNNNLWVLAGDLYIIKNGTDNATWLYSLPMGINPLMKENKLTNEIFVASQNGLFVCKN